MFSKCCNSRIKLWRNKKNPQRIIKIKAFITKYNWKGINYLLEIVDWKNIEENNVTIALNIFYAKQEKIESAYVSKHNSNHEK